MPLVFSTSKMIIWLEQKTFTDNLMAPFTSLLQQNTISSWQQQSSSDSTRSFLDSCFISTTYEEGVVKLINVMLTHYAKHISKTVWACTRSLVAEVVTGKNCSWFNLSTNGIPWWIDGIISLQGFLKLCRIVEYRSEWKINYGG